MDLVLNATDKIKNQENQVSKENMKTKTKQTQYPPALNEVKELKRTKLFF